MRALGDVMNAFTQLGLLHDEKKRRTASTKALYDCLLPRKKKSGWSLSRLSTALKNLKAFLIGNKAYMVREQSAPGSFLWWTITHKYNH